MYESFYGLVRTPFAVTPDPSKLFMSRVHREALATIIYGVETRKGFIVCTGEVGTGKSTIIRAFFDQMPSGSAKLIYIFTPQVTPFEMARYICRELGLAEPESVFAAVPQLQLKLLEIFESGQTVVLMIDEGQLLPPETLEFLRLLSNFETDTEKLIQIVLVGQPEMDALLARRDMRQVAQRVALRARLSPFEIEESVAYLDHRLRVSGAADIAQVMSPSAAWLIAEAAGGIPRCLNILADNALIAGFAAAQRPLGSRLAGATVGEFLGQPAPAKPAAGRRLGAGWGIARRLQGALAREKEEPTGWVAAPLPPSVSPAEATQPAAARDGRPAVTTARHEPETKSSPEWVEPTEILLRPEQPAVVVDAVAQRHSPPDSGSWGLPVSSAGIAVIEPVARAGAPPVRPAAPRPAPAFAALSRPPVPGADDRPPPAPTAPATQRIAARQWPALSRVRNGLEDAPSLAVKRVNRL